MKRVREFAAFVAVMVALAYSVTAPVTAADLEEVVVTGTRVQNANLTAASPVSVYNADQLQAVNTVNVEEFLRDLPQFSPSVGAQGNNGNNGSATVDLRNLDEERTLVLVDGKRFTPFDSQGYVDLGMIPASLVKRVEVLTGGASAVYGADAVSGVVNFIMKDDFEGLQLDLSYGVTEEGDGDTTEFSLTTGGNFADSRGNVVLNIGYSTSEQIVQGDRSFSVETFDDLLNPVGSSTVPRGGVFDAIGSFQFSDSGGQIEPRTDRFNFNPFNLFQVPQDKWTITALADYEINDNLRAYARGSVANNEIDTVIAPSGTFFFSFNVPYAANPGGFLGDTAIARLAANDAMELGATANNGIAEGLLIGRRTVEVGPRISQYENSAFQVVAGLEGNLANDWEWETFAQFGQTSRTQNFLNDLNAINVQAGINGCPAGSAAGCVPVNLFGLNTITPAMANFIRLNLVETNKTDQVIVGSSLTGEITALSLPGTSSGLGFAAGLEYRDESALNRPDSNYASGNSIGFGASSPVSTNFDVIEYFAEAALPLLESMAGAEAVSLEGGVRFSDYDYQVNDVNNSFDTTTWKLQLGWAVNDTVKLRGGFNRAVRTPSIQEAGLPLTPSTGDLDQDPCEGTNPLGDPALTQLCIDTGVPASQIGRVTSIISGQINNFIGGNANLQPEEADTYTMGLVFTPAGSPFTLTLDYYDISVANAIVQLAEQDVVDGCYNIQRNASSRFCQLITRNSLGGLIGPTTVGVNVAVQNSAILEQKGVDFGLTYSYDAGDAGAFDFDLQGNYLIDNKQQAADFTPLNNCVGLVGNTCQDPDHEWRFVQTTSWNKGPWDLQLRWQYLDGVTNDSIVLAGNSPSNFALPSIDSEHYFDLTGRYQLNDRFQFRAGILNLFDTDPPVVGNDFGGTLQNSGNTYPATYDPLGRRYFFGVRTTL
ncbi:MAG: TonB-dependent receptor [Gammaproteobacteria bacterium]|nr:TonB-dependent receptor [Gammaproteobacteria bacterium]